MIEAPAIPRVVEGVEHLPGDFDESLVYEMKGAAQELVRSIDPEILYEGPRGTGKTLADVWRTHLFCEEYAGSKHLWCRLDRARMNKTVLDHYERFVLGGRKIDSSTARKETRTQYSYENGSVIYLAGLQDMSVFRSTEFDMITVFEATDPGITEEMFVDLTKTLDRCNNIRLPKTGAVLSQIIAECNPKEPEHWLNQRAARGLMRRILSRHEDNPSLTPQYLARLGKLEGIDRDREFLGKWSGGSGSLYFDGGLIGRLREEARRLLAVRAPGESGTLVAA